MLSCLLASEVLAIRNANARALQILRYQSVARARACVTVHLPHERQDGERSQQLCL